MSEISEVYMLIDVASNAGVLQAEKSAMRKKLN